MQKDAYGKIAAGTGPAAAATTEAAEARNREAGSRGLYCSNNIRHTRSKCALKYFTHYLPEPESRWEHLHLKKNERNENQNLIGTSEIHLNQNDFSPHLIRYPVGVRPFVVTSSVRTYLDNR